MARTNIRGTQILDATVDLTVDVTGTLPVANGGTGAATLSGMLIGNGTSAVSTVSAPSGTVVGTSDTQTLTNKRVNPRVSSTSSASTITPDSDSYDMVVVTALAAALTIAAPTGTPVAGQKLMMRIKDNGTARALTWNAAYVSSGVANLPSTTVISKTHHIGFVYDDAAAKWICLAADPNGY